MVVLASADAVVGESRYLECSLALLKQAKTGHLPPERFWGDILATLPIVMIGADDAICIQETTAYMDGTALSVWQHGPGKRATLGTTQRYRVNGSLTYDMNADAPNGLISGKPGTPNLLVGQKSSCRLDFLVNREGKTKFDWLVGMKHVRKRMPPIPNSYFHDKFQHDILCDLPRPEAPVCTFAQAHDRISQLAALTDNAPQIARVWGWQYRGKDTGYPAVDQVNPRLGTYEDLLKLKHEAKASNTLPCAEEWNGNSLPGRTPISIAAVPPTMLSTSAPRGDDSDSTTEWPSRSRSSRIGPAAS